MFTALGPDFIKRLANLMMEDSVRVEKTRVLFGLLVRFVRYAKCNQCVGYTQQWTDASRKEQLAQRLEGLRLCVQIKNLAPKLVRSLYFFCGQVRAWSRGKRALGFIHQFYPAQTCV